MQSDFANTDVEYAYNANGAMTKDLNKGITNISYNLLNLPQQIDILSPLAEARNAYSYSADGVKLRVVKKYNSNFNTSPIIGSAVNVSSMDVTKTTDYVDGKIFENNTLDRIQVDGGYIKGGVYYFYETNHLGDNRTVINQLGTVVERNDYYPYGMQMAHNQMLNQASGSDNKRKFSGKELDVMSGLNLYDSQARSYDPTLGIFTTSDPLAEEDYNISPYVYCGDNPVLYTDPDGKLFGLDNFIGAVVGAAVDYGTQVAVNYVQGKSNPFTENINLVSIGTAAVAGALTSGGSAIVKSIGGRALVETGQHLVNNTVKVTTTSSGLKKEVETNPVNIVKNAAIDKAAGAAIGKGGAKLEGTINKKLITNAGNLRSPAKSMVRATGHNVTRSATTTAKGYINTTAKVANKTISKGLSVATNGYVDFMKKKTDIKQ